jgi:hypothetical protein
MISSVAVRASLIVMVMGLFVPKTTSISPTVRFVPLSCNDDIGNVPCDSWSDRFGTRTTFSNPVIVPCGECIRMDSAMNDRTLTFGDGIDIQGKLLMGIHPFTFYSSVKMNVKDLPQSMRTEINVTTTVLHFVRLERKLLLLLVVKSLVRMNYVALLCFDFIHSSN